MKNSIEQARKLFGKEVCRLRVDILGLAQDAFGLLIHCGQAKVSRIEAGRCGVDEHDARAIAEAARLEPGEADRLVQWAAHTGSRKRRVEWSGSLSAVPEWFRPVISREREATEIIALHRGRVPGFLQSELYMLKMHDLEKGLTKKQAHDHNVNRYCRTQIFTQDAPPIVRVILQEAALTWVPGGDPALQRDHLDNLDRVLRTYPSVSIHIVPTLDHQLGDFPPDFTAYLFGEYDRELDGTVNHHPVPAVDDFVHVEQPLRGVNIEDAKLVRAHVQKWDSVLPHTLDRELSHKLIGKTLHERQ